MKRTAVSIFALCTVVALLSACSSMKRDEEPVMTSSPEISTPAPQVTVMPDLNDGVVNDRDGIIEESDNPGTAQSPTPIEPRSEKNPGSSNAGPNAGTPSMSPKPSEKP